MSPIKRQRNVAIPRHIDQDKIPAGLYFDARKGAGRWYMLTRDDAGKQRRRNVASAEVALSDLHRISEEARGKAPGALSALCEAFHGSAQFRALSAATRTDYEYCRGVVLSYETGRYGALGKLPVRQLTPAGMQQVIDKLALGGPSKAAHALRYLRRLFRWGIQRGHCASNPAGGVQQPAERKRRRLPSAATLAAVIAFARERGARRGRTEGACPSYLWAALELAYLCRLRGIEVITLSDANALADGVQTNRRKGSRDNVVTWTPRLRAAWSALEERRAAIWRGRSRPIPMRAEDRPLVVSESGDALSKSAFDTAWQRFVAVAIDAGVLREDERFAPHDLKRRGITDTAGTRADKQEASGHRAEAMLDIYDLSMPRVDPAGK